MELGPLRARFLESLKAELTDWKFVSSRRSFRRSCPGKNQIVHIAFISHDTDFDVTVDVAVEYIADRVPVCVVGAELGNIMGIGQRRYGVSSLESARDAAIQASRDLAEIGFPFIERLSNPEFVISVLRRGGAEATLISPVRDLHHSQIVALSRLGAGV